MANTIEARILEALVKRLAAMPGGVPIVYPNTNYPAPGAQKSAKFLAVSHSPNNPLRIHIDPNAAHIHRGVFGIAVMTPLDAGVIAPLEIAGQIADWFQGQVLIEGSTSVEITVRPYPATGYKDVDRWRTPVVIEFATRAV